MKGFASAILMDLSCVNSQMSSPDFWGENTDVAMQIDTTTTIEYVEGRRLGVTLDKNLQSWPEGYCTATEGGINTASLQF